MKRVPIVAVLAVGAIAAVSLTAQTSGGAVVRLDPALDQIISRNAKLEMMKTDYFGISEGPVWVRDGGPGYLLFSDIGANAIYKWTPAGTLSVFLEKAGYVGEDFATVGNVASNGRLYISTAGPNGLALDREGRLVLCAQGDRAIVRIEKDGSRSILADRYDGKRLNSPNDLAIRSNGSIYFTDTGAGLRGGLANSPQRELPFTGLFMINDGKVQLLEQSLRPNGLAFSPDEKYLYVTNAGRLMRYEVRPDGALSNGVVWVDMTADKAPGGTDGMKVDQRGSVYATGPGGIWILSPAGKHLGTILLPETATNLAFGDADGKTLYITDRRSLARIRLNVSGMTPRTQRAS